MTQRMTRGLQNHRKWMSAGEHAYDIAAADRAVAMNRKCHLEGARAVRDHGDEEI